MLAVRKDHRESARIFAAVYGGKEAEYLFFIIWITGGVQKGVYMQWKGIFVCYEKTDYFEY